MNRLLVGSVIAAIFGLSVHVLMQQGLDVSYPDLHLIPSWAKLFNSFGAWAAVVFLWQTDHRRNPTRSWIHRWILISLIYLLSKETIRGAVMEGVVTTAYALHLAMAIPAVLAGTAMCGLAGLAARLCSLRLSVILSGSIVAAVANFFWGPFVTSQFGMWIGGLGLPDHDAIYQPPYGMHVLIPAYVAYLEPTIGALLFVRLLGIPYVRRGLLGTMALYLLLTGILLPPILWSFWGPFAFPKAFMSTFQFTLEHAVLIVGIALAWRWSDRGRIGQ